MDVAMDDKIPPERGAASVQATEVDGATLAVRVRQRPRWRVERAQQVESATPSSAAPKHRLCGTPRLLLDRILVQVGAGAELGSVQRFVDQEKSGLVVSMGRSNLDSVRRQIAQLSDGGFVAPIVFDPEGYRKHIATAERPFLLASDRLLPGALEESIDSQIGLGVSVAQTPTGYIRLGALDALRAAVYQTLEVHREDFIFTLPIEASILDDPSSVEEVADIVGLLRVPVSLILGCQFDAFDDHAEARVKAVRRLVGGSANFCAFRTDFNGFDLIGHGAFAAAIGVGGSKRHAVAPGQQPHSLDPSDTSPSVLYPELASFHRGSWIARQHGRVPAPICRCEACWYASLARFLSRGYSAEARAHNVAVWQGWARLLLSNATQTGRAGFWKNVCKAAMEEHRFLAARLGQTKPLAARGSLRAWANLSI